MFIPIFWWWERLPRSNICLLCSSPTWGRIPFWLICFKWVETTNQQNFAWESDVCVWNFKHVIIQGSWKISHILPWKLTCPLKIDGWKMYSLLKWSLFKGHVSFQGCICWRFGKFLWKKWIIWSFQHWISEVYRNHQVDLPISGDRVW